MCVCVCVCVCERERERERERCFHDNFHAFLYWWLLFCFILWCQFCGCLPLFKLRKMSKLPDTFLLKTSEDLDRQWYDNASNCQWGGRNHVWQHFVSPNIVY